MVEDIDPEYIPEPLFHGQDTFWDPWEDRTTYKHPEVNYHSSLELDELLVKFSHAQLINKDDFPQKNMIYHLLDWKTMSTKSYSIQKEELQPLR